ncbi:MAG: RnfABCDGE type electron transport complex subunit D [Candidatus Omnitrophica bacterium]|nr:RnfABCDGE type electron transport complex subunit D [Candidatus Omnitrophota bacterium]
MRKNSAHPLRLSSSPHLQGKRSTPWLMWQVVIALIPAAGASLFFFRTHALWLLVLCVGGAAAAEAVIVKIRGRKLTLRDGSAVLTGILLALVLPPFTTWYAALLGAAVAILIGKHLFGGLGANIFNPALIGRAFLLSAYPAMLTTFAVPGNLDAVTKATPLYLLKSQGIETPLLPLFTGTIGGCIGETSAVCLLIGGVYLLARKIVDWRIPLSFLGTVILMSTIFWILRPQSGSPAFHLLSGGMLLGILFMATDPVTTPSTKTGRYLFGTFCGIVIMILRYFSGLPEGVMYGILFMNAFVPLINRYTKPRRFGTGKMSTA